MRIVRVTRIARFLVGGEGRWAHDTCALGPAHLHRFHSHHGDGIRRTMVHALVPFTSYGTRHQSWSIACLWPDPLIRKEATRWRAFDRGIFRSIGSTHILTLNSTHTCSRVALRVPFPSWNWSSSVSRCRIISHECDGGKAEREEKGFDELRYCCQLCGKKSTSDDRPIETRLAAVHRPNPEDFAANRSLDDHDGLLERLIWQR